LKIPQSSKLLLWSTAGRSADPRIAAPDVGIVDGAPLYFGGYGGPPLKIIWTLLDLVSIVVLGSGLYFWLSRRRSPLEERVAEIESGGNIPAVLR
jgi:uncharacterized iron-regulated membrane protein